MASLVVREGSGVRRAWPESGAGRGTLAGDGGAARGGLWDLGGDAESGEAEVRSRTLHQSIPNSMYAVYNYSH